MRIKRLSVVASLLLCTVAIPIGVLADPPTVHPARTTLRASDYGPNATFINGSVLSNAFLALDTVKHLEGASADNGWLMMMNDNGEYFAISPSPNKPNALTVQVSNGQSLVVPASSMPVVGASITLGSLRSIRAAYEYFQTESDLPPGGDRQISNYDVLVYPFSSAQYHGRYAGKLFVSLLHHRNPNIKNSFAGCFDGSGYDAGYVVDPGTLNVTSRPCA